MAHSTNKRNNANDSNIEVKEFGKSSFDLSYKAKCAGKIGKRHLVGYELVMNGDRVRVNGHFDFQFQPTSSNMLPAMDMRIEHVFLPWRVVNRDYEDQSSFVDGQAWEALPFASSYLSHFEEQFDAYVPQETIQAALALNEQRILTVFDNACSRLRGILLNYYLADYADDLKVHFHRMLSGWTSMTADAKESVLCQCLYDLISEFVGKGSNLDHLNAPIIHPDVFRSYFKQLRLSTTASLSDVVIMSAQHYDNLPILEMMVRALYADWFETTRDSILEPAKGLPRYRNWGASNIDKDVLYFCCLAPRYALLGKDIFTTANTDSPYRHVLAPIASTTRVAQVVGADNDPQNLTQPLLNVNVPVTVRMNGLNNYNALDNLATHAVNFTGIDLVAIRRAQMARNWLLRGKIFGDEYQDFILAQYGVKLSDNRVNKPWRLGGYSQEVDIDTTTNATATAQMPAGAKNCSMTVSGGTDNKEFFSEEAGILLTWAYLVPAVTYTPYDIRHTMQNVTDIPQPVMANQSEELSFATEICRDITTPIQQTPFGRHPSYHAWRGRVDENHDMFIDEYKPMTFLREFSDNNVPVLNYAFIHTHVRLDFMVDTDAWNPVYFGTFSNNVRVQRELPIVTDVC